MVLNNDILASIQLLQDMGLVTKELRDIYTVTEYNPPKFFLNTIGLIFTQVPSCLRKMECLLNNDVVNFHDMEEQCIKMVGSTLSVGAIQLKKACSDLKLAAASKSKEGCVEALNVVKAEYETLKSHLLPIIEMDANDLKGEHNLREYECILPRRFFRRV